MTPSVVLVTSNQAKAQEIQAALQPYGIKLQSRQFDLVEPKSLQLEEVVRVKVEAAWQHWRKPVLVDDTGIFFVGYRNFPGAYSKFAFQALGYDGLFRLLKSGQRAYFCSYLAYKQSARQPVKIFRGVCHGQVITHCRGRRKPSMPYDSFFIPDGDKLTFAQMSVAGKQRYDHRSKAVRQFAKYYLRTQP